MTAAEVRAREVISRLPDGPVAGAEIGVHDGRMSAHLLRLRPDLTLWMVDNWRGAEAQPTAYRDTGDPRARLTGSEQEAAARRAEQATAFAAERRHVWPMDSCIAASHTPAASLDFVFLDADHSYVAMVADLWAWRPKVRPGGLLCGHDYEPRFPGVVRAVDEAAERYGWGVELGLNHTWFVQL